MLLMAPWDSVQAAPFSFTRFRVICTPPASLLAFPLFPFPISFSPVIPPQRTMTFLYDVNWLCISFLAGDTFLCCVFEIFFPFSFVYTSFFPPVEEGGYLSLASLS